MAIAGDFKNAMLLLGRPIGKHWVGWQIGRELQLAALSRIEHWGFCVC
jgi:hypothetical protein